MISSKIHAILKQQNIGFKGMVHFSVKQNCLSKQIPSDGLPIVGSLFSLIASGSSPKLHLYINAKHKKLGSIFQEVMPTTTTIFLSDPEKIREVFRSEGKYPCHFLPESWLIYNRMYGCKRGLLFMDGEEWLHYRKMLNQFLIRDDIANELSHVYKIIIESLINKWKQYDGKCLEHLERDMYTHSICFLLATAVGSSFHKHSSTFQKDLEILTDAYQQIFTATSRLMLVPVKLVSKLNLPVWKSFVSAMDKSLSGSEAVISKMVKVISNDGLIKKLLDAGVKERMVNALLTDLMIAAGDTTAFTMQWALYLLGQNEHIQTEIMSDEDVVKGVIREALRLYPAAPFLTRVLEQPLQIQGHHVPAGQLVVMSMYTCGRDRSNYPQPHVFQPHRWARDQHGRLTAVTNTSASLPFSMGARSCVGKKLAQTLMTSTISQIVTNYRLKTLRPVDMILRMTPAPAQPIQIHIDSR